MSVTDRRTDKEFEACEWMAVRVWVDWGGWLRQDEDKNEHNHLQINTVNQVGVVIC